jgi:uncharacterized protein with von Willebrand factor type A (vWA) domain
MFGKKREAKPSTPYSDDLETVLREGGAVSAPATIVSARQGHVISKGHGNVEIDYATWHLQVRVEPPNAPPFDAKFSQVFTLSNMLRANLGPYTALYDPADRTRVRIDTAAWRAHFKNDAMQQQIAQAAEQYRLTGTVPRVGPDGLVSGASAPTVLEQMEKLVASGSMTQEQYEVAKRRVRGET